MKNISAQPIADQFAYFSTLEQVHFNSNSQEIISKKCDPAPLLVGFLANSDPAAVKYAEWTAKSCEKVGLRFELRQVTRMELEDAIVDANADKNVHGIMVYYPVFGGSQACGMIIEKISYLSRISIFRILSP